MSALRCEVERQMRLRSFSPRTHESYIHALEELARYYWRPLESLTCEQVQRFLDHIISERKLSWSTVNVYFSACRFLYEKTLKHNRREFSMPRRGRSGKRPAVLSPEEVGRILAALRNLKHRALLHMTFGSGLRVSEVIKVRPRHIDRGRLMLFVQGGKGHKDRYTILSKKALGLLEEHWRANGPFEYFFYGENKNAPMSVNTAQNVYNHAVENSGVRRVGGIHVLRHCFATFMVEAGVEIQVIQRWMGHRAMATTAGYMHVRSERLRNIESPLDTLGREQ